VGSTQQRAPQDIEVLTQYKRIDLLNTPAQFALPGLREDPRGQQSLQRRLGCFIHTMHLLALENFGLQLEGGLKAIDDEPQRPVDLAELGVGL
jgi:hypothetical protein